jgi:hypothetical protein
MSSPRRNTNESKSSSILKPATKPEANNSQKMENSTLLNNDVLSTFYTKDENSFLKKISKFNMNFFILSDKYLKMKTDLDKMNDNIYLNLFKQINAYIEEIERLNLKLREKGENSKLKIENITELNKEILNQKNTIRTLEKQISDKINSEIKLKNEINSYKRQVTFYKDKLKIQLQNRSIAKERAAEKENNTNTSINNTLINNNSTNERNPSKESKDQKEKEIFRSGSSSNLKKKYLNKTLELTIDSDEEKEKSIIANTNTNNNNNNVSNSTNNTPSSKKSIKFSSFKNVKGQTGSMTTSQLRKFVPSTLSRTQIANPNQIKKTLYEKGKLKKNLNSAHQKGNKAGNMSFVEEDIFTNKFSIKDELNKTVSAIKMDAFSPKKEIEDKKKIKKTYHKTYTIKNAKLNNNNNNSKILKTNNNINNTNNNHQVQINIGSINNNNYTLGKNSITENMKKTMKDINDDYEKHLEVLNKEEEEIKKLLELMNVKIDLPNIVNKNSFNNEKQQNISILSIESNPNSRKVSENNKNEEEKKENDKKNEEKKENDKKNEENNKEEIKKENDNNSKVNNNDKK